MKIVVALDSFKGSLGSRDAGTAVSRGLHQAWYLSSLPPTEGRAQEALEVKVMTLSDGGEGMLAAVADAAGVATESVLTTDPSGRPILSRVVKKGDAMIIESALACGLTLIPADLRNPMVADSGGVGILLRYAIGRGCKKIIIGLGGSGVNDAGVGMLREMGYRFLDRSGREVSRGGQGVGNIAEIDARNAIRLPEGCEIIIASDVDNPLCGPSGASRVFGRQKGASPEMVGTLDGNLKRFSRVAAAFIGKDYSEAAGAGAAGGLGFALMAFLGARMESGIDVMLDLIGFDDALAGADLVITGEGRIDWQTRMGKAPWGVMRRAVEMGVPTVAVGGSVDRGAVVKLMEDGFTAVLPIAHGPCSEEEAMRPDVACGNLQIAGLNILRLFRHGMGCSREQS